MIRFESFFDIPNVFNKSNFEAYHDQYQDQIIGIYHEYRRYVSAKQSLSKNYNLSSNFHSIIPLAIFRHFDTFIILPPAFTPIMNNINPKWFYNMFNIIYKDQLKLMSEDIVNIITSYVICYINQLDFWEHVTNSLFNNNIEIMN